MRLLMPAERLTRRALAARASVPLRFAWPARLTASGSTRAQRCGGRPVVVVQAGHLPGELLDLRGLLRLCPRVLRG